MTLTNFELIVYKLIAEEHELARFEEWIYSSKELETILDAEEYLAIISLDYSQLSSLYEAEKIFRQYIDTGKYYEWYIIRILQQIIDPPIDAYKYIEQCYDLYCNGFSFLNNLGLNYGLRIRVPPANYSADSWYELTSAEQIKLIDSFYPDVAESAQEVLNWFSDRQIVVIDRDEANKSVDYLDNRIDIQQ